MFEVAPETASMLYVGSFLFILFSIWAYDGWKYNKKNISSSFSKEKVICEFCGHHFRKDSMLPILRCPLCKCLIKE